MHQAQGCATSWRLCRILTSGKLRIPSTLPKRALSCAAAAPVDSVLTSSSALRASYQKQQQQQQRESFPSCLSLLPRHRQQPREPHEPLSPPTQLLQARLALAARLASGPLADTQDASSDGAPPMAVELRATAKRAVLALRQTQRLVHAGIHEDGERRGEEPGGAVGRGMARDAAADDHVGRRGLANGALADSAAWALDTEEGSMGAGVTGLRGISYGAALSGTETVSLLAWCAGELMRLAERIEQTVVAREKPLLETRDGMADAAAGIPRELRVAQQRLYTRESTGDGATPPSPFLDPLRSVDLLETAALLLSLLRDYLRTLVEDVLVMDGTVDSVAEERAISRVAHEVTVRVVSVLGDSVVAKVLAGVAEAERLLTREEGTLHGAAFFPPLPDRAEEDVGEAEEEEAPSFTSALLTFSLRHLLFTEDVLFWAICSQRTHGRRALELAGQLYAHNGRMANAHGPAAAAKPLTPSLELVAHKASYDVVMALAYVLAQHGEWSLCLRLLDPVSPTQPESGSGPFASTALARLLLSVALANAPRDDEQQRIPSPPRTAPSQLLALVFRDVEAGTGQRESETSTRQGLLVHLVSLGIAPSRPPSVAEYGAVVRQFLRRRHQKPREDGSAEAESRRTTDGGHDVSWVLSPSGVWRHTNGFPHHIRATLCLLGFQVLVKHGLVDSMTMEDLLVILSLTRQMRRQRSGALRLRHHHYRRAVTSPQEGQLHDDDDEAEGEHAARAEEEEAEEEESASALCGAFPSFLLPAACRAPPAGQEHLVRLCEAYCTVCRRYPSPHAQPFADPSSSDQETLPAGRRSPPYPPYHLRDKGSAVMLSVLSHELLALLKAAHYERAVPAFWDAVLAAVGTIMPHEGLSAETVQTIEELVQALIHAIREAASAPARSDDDISEAEETHLSAPLGDSSRPRGGCRASSPSARGARQRGEDVIAALVDPLVRLAPYVSPFTVALAVQSPAGRFLSPQDCLRLIPYAPLGSRSQTQLLRRVAQYGPGQASTARLLDAYAPPHGGPRDTVSPSRLPVSPPPPPPTTTTAVTAPTAVGTLSVAAAAAATTTTLAAVRAKAGAIVADEQEMLSLLMERSWSKALRRFEQAAPRVRVAGAAHVVRLVIEADAWRDVGDAQLRPLVRLAIHSTRSSAPTEEEKGADAGGGAGGDVPADFAEEVLHTTLAHGMWATGLSFHQLLVEEQPERMRRSQRARQYAAMLCEGLMQKTALARTIAEVFQATRAASWEVASAHFVLYATGNSSSSISSIPTGEEEAQVGKGNAADKKPAHRGTLSRQMATHILDLAVTKLKAERKPATTSTATPSTAVPVGTDCRQWPFAVQVPAELATFAQATRYALLRTPQTRDYAFQWFPPSALPVTVALRAELESRYGRDFLAASGVLVPTESLSVDTPTKAGATQAALPPTSPPPSPATATHSALADGRAVSLIEAVRHHPDSVVHRPAWTLAKANHETVLDVLQLLHTRGQWEASLSVYQHALENGCLPYQASATVLRTTLIGGAPWAVTLACFEHMSRRMRPDVLSTAAALEACAAGGQWQMALRVLKQSVLTQTSPVPKAVDLAINVALQCGAWSRALQTAHMYRGTRSPQLAHTVLNTYVATRHWNDAVEYFYDCTVRGVKPLDASLELALVASHAASEEYKRTAMMVGAIASALEDLYTMTGAVLEHIVFVHRHRQWHEVQTHQDEGSSESMDGGFAGNGTGSHTYVYPYSASYTVHEERAGAAHVVEQAYALSDDDGQQPRQVQHRQHEAGHPSPQNRRRWGKRGKGRDERGNSSSSANSPIWNPTLLLDPPY